MYPLFIRVSLQIMDVYITFDHKTNKICKYSMIKYYFTKFVENSYNYNANLISVISFYEYLQYLICFLCFLYDYFTKIQVLF